MKSLLFLPFYLREDKYVQNLEDPNGINDKQRHKPVHIFLLRGLPKGDAFPRKRPEGEGGNGPDRHAVQELIHKKFYPLKNKQRDPCCSHHDRDKNSEDV